MKQKSWKRAGIGAGCAALAAAMALGLLGGGPQTAEAATSLPRIEALKTALIQQGGSFVVLEIAPGEGELGYYIDGQEPCADWLSHLKTLSTKAEREAYANALFADLTTRGLISPESAAAPLTYKVLPENGVYYEEAYPWEDCTGMEKLQLAQPETVEHVEGSYTFPEEGGTGDFDANWSFVIDGAAGTWDQNIQRLDYGAVIAGAYYYENPTFGAVAPPVLTDVKNTPDDPTDDQYVFAELAEGEAVYAGVTGTAAGGEATYLTAADAALGGKPLYYSCVGLMSESLELDGTLQYFTLEDPGVPTKTASQTAYAATADGFLLSGDTDGDGLIGDGETAGSGAFRRQLEGYTYVGKGEGDYIFTASSGGTYEGTVQTSEIYYRGGYLNNNWFSTQVLDLETEDDLSYIVNTVTPDLVTAAMVEKADLLVLSGGYGSQQAFSTSFRDGIADAIYTAVSEAQKPVLVDGGLLQGASDVSALAGRILQEYAAQDGDADGTYLYQNVLRLSAGLKIDDQTVINGLATPYFGREISGDSLQGLTAVGEEIRYENFLRGQEGRSDDLLPDTATLARAVRYILNFSEQRVVEEKTAIEVLELEPATKNAQLTEDMVRSWLPDTNKVETIHITTMSAYEFVGKIEDLSETYDLIYIGDSLTGLNQSGGEAVYRDSDNMNGLLYTNVGDTVVTKAELAGMMDRDYSYGALNTGSETSYTFRYSGNDLTAAREEDLLNFARAGYPVILGDELVNGSEESGRTLAFTAVLSGSAGEGGAAELTVSLVDETYGNVLTPVSYTWYRAVGDGAFEAFTPTAGASTKAGYSMIRVDAAEETQRYYCEVTVEGGIAAAASNVLKLEQGTYTVTTGGSADPGSYANRSVSNSLTATLSGFRDGYTYSSAPTLSVQLKSGSTTLNADQLEVTYRWMIGYEDWFGDITWYDLGGSGDAAYRPQNMNGCYYRCGVTVNDGEEALTNAVSFTWTSGNKNRKYTARNEGGAENGTYHPMQAFSVSVQSAVTENGCTLTASSAATPAAAVKYYWSLDSSWNAAAGYSPDASDSWAGTGKIFSPQLTNTTETYYCYAFYFYSDVAASYEDQFSRDYARSYAVTVHKPGANVTEDGEGQNGSFVVTASANSERVDNSSYLYETINSALSYGNVMSEEKAKTQQDVVLQYLNLSKPQILWTDGKETSSDTAYSYPTEYEMTGAGMTTLTAAADGKYYLTYSFSIENQADPYTNTTTYDCRLYLDQDSSGLYTTEEQITDIVVREGSAIVNRDSAGRYKLKAGVTYSVSRQMPASYVGIIPWKLEIVKNAENGSAYVHASKTNYTRIAPSADARQTIRILQIASSTTGKTEALHHVSLQQQLETVENNPNSDCYSAATGKTYRGIYGKLLADVTDFDISIETVRADLLLEKLDASTVNEIYDELTRNYNMIIIGYDDMYQELPKNAAQAIVNFIDSGKSVLFTHDTTSLSNVDASTKAQSGLAFQNPGYWGYYFNSLLRTPVGLDRYGIRSSAMSDVLAAQNAGTNLTYTQIAALTQEDFSVSYLPGSARSATAAEVQGYSNYDLIRYKSKGSTFVTGISARDADRTTTEVSQLNAGQITTYPYNVNTALFSGTADGENRMSVGTTHEQPYQINLNSEDTVVWYCLSGSYYLENDAMNAYYIYSKGNVTYSGMGHSVAGTYQNYEGAVIGEAYQNEAKLFVNTMIAAYRTVNESPSVKFTPDESGVGKQAYYFLTSDDVASQTENVLLENTAEFGEETDSTLVYFKLTDPNLNRGKSIGASLYYTTDGDVTEVTDARVTQLTGDALPTVYQAETNTTVSLSDLTGGYVYEFHLPSAVMTALSDGAVQSVRLFLKITTQIDGVTYENTASLDLRKVSLNKLK